MHKYFVLIILFSFWKISFSQRVYEVNYPTQADVNLYVVKYESQCDLKVCLVQNASQAKNDGLWLRVKYESQADIKIHYVNYESQADLKIFYVDYPSQAGWKNKDKIGSLSSVISGSRFNDKD